MTKAGYIAIIGRPNAGKSTLLNSIIETKLSIVTPKKQTTRKRVIGIYSDDNSQIVFIDTPGIIKPKYELHRAMMKFVEESIKEADALLFILDAVDFIKREDYFHEAIIELLKNSKKDIILALNKIDLLYNEEALEKIIERLKALELFSEIIPVSALEEKNVKTLMNSLIAKLPEGEFIYDPDYISIQPERFFVAELIREVIFNLLEQELPYSAEIEIAEFREREIGKWYIAADIIIERDSQKKIVIGKNGSMIKKIGQEARVSIEEHLNMPVFLELFVKVKPNWRESKQYLKSFGYKA